MRGRWAVILVVGAAALSVTAFGCGDDDDPITPITTESTSPDAASPSDDDFIASADSICAEANAAIANLSTGTEVSSVAAGQQLEITQGLIESLQALGSPADANGALAEFYASLEDQVAVLEQQEEAAASGDVVTANALATELDAARNETLGAADDYGFDECGQQGTTLPPGAAPPGTPAPTVPAPEPAEPVAPVTPAEPVTPVEPEPEPVSPPTGGTDTGEGGSTGDPGGETGGSSGGIGPG